MSQITSHILDTSTGKPARNVQVTLFQYLENQWIVVASGDTDSDGRVTKLLDPGCIMPSGVYRMNFNTGKYFTNNGANGFYPYIDIVFTLEDGGEHYHIPLLLSPFGYSTYRGS